MSQSWTKIYFLALCLALRALASTWTPCSLDAWILNLQSCSQPCYGETYYDTFFNSTACGDYDAELSSTKKWDVECLCKNQIAGTSAQTNITNCSVALCGDSFNETRYVDDLKAWTRMCNWSFGKLSGEKHPCRTLLSPNGDRRRNM